MTNIRETRNRFMRTYGLAIILLLDITAIVTVTKYLSDKTPDRTVNREVKVVVSVPASDLPPGVVEMRTIERKVGR